MRNKLEIKRYQQHVIAVYRPNGGSAIMRTIRDDSTDSRASLERWIERYYERKKK